MGEEASRDMGNGESGPSLRNGYASPQPLSPLADSMHSGEMEMAGVNTGSLGNAFPYEIETAVQSLDEVGVP